MPILVQQIPESIQYPSILLLLLRQGALSVAERVKAFRLKIAQRMAELKQQPLEMLFLVFSGAATVGLMGTGSITCEVFKIDVVYIYIVYIIS